MGTDVSMLVGLDYKTPAEFLAFVGTNGYDISMLNLTYD